MAESAKGKKSASDTRFSYKKIDKELQKFISDKGYKILSRISAGDHGTFTYQVEKEEMPFWVKIGHSDILDKGVSLGGDRIDEDTFANRIDDLKNEVAALTALWKRYPSGETDSFQFPPGAEEIFSGEIDGLKIYGYARFVVEGNVLGKALRDKSIIFSNWVEPCGKMVKTLDSLPELRLPSSSRMKDIDFAQFITKKASYWRDQLQLLSKKNENGVTLDLVKRTEHIAQETEDYVSKNKIVMGSVHGDFQPDHIVYLERGTFPTLVQFSKICQWYPRYWDIATMYAWVAVVLGDVEGAKNFWSHVSEKNGLSKDEIVYLKVITNVVTLGMIAQHRKPSLEGGKRAIGAEAFV